MKIIEIKVENKRPIVLNHQVIVCGNSDYVISFAFDNEWSEYEVKTARFNYTRNGQSLYEEVVFSGTECKVPVLSDIFEVAVGVYAGDISTTTPVYIACDKSITCAEGTNEEPDEDVYNQIVELCNEAVTTAKDVETRANNGEFDGKDYVLTDGDMAEIQEYVDERTEIISADIEGLRTQLNEEAHFRGYLSTNAKIQALEATPNDFAYSAESGTKWVYDADLGWQDTNTPVPDQLTPASNATPLVNGVATSGQANEYARGDHRHPTDLTRASVEDLNKKADKHNYVYFSNGDTITLEDNITYYTEGTISNLTIIYPSENFICSLEFTLASTGDITITLPESKYIGGAPTFANGETWELNIKNGVVVGGLVE